MRGASSLGVQHPDSVSEGLSKIITLYDKLQKTLIDADKMQTQFDSNMLSISYREREYLHHQMQLIDRKYRYAQDIDSGEFQVKTPVGSF